MGQAALGSMSKEQKEKLRSYWGVDEPPVQRYLNWLNAFIKGDGGISLLYRQPVTKVIAVKLGNSLFLMGLAWVVSGLVGFLLEMCIRDRSRHIHGWFCRRELRFLYRWLFLICWEIPSGITWIRRIAGSSDARQSEAEIRGFQNTILNSFVLSKRK